jgi:hypothetical protein
MGRSKRAPSLGRSAGERLTVTRPAGQSNAEVGRADQMRSRLSLTALSGSPTREKAGRPGPDVDVDADLGSIEGELGSGEDGGEHGRNPLR